MQADQELIEENRDSEEVNQKGCQDTLKINHFKGNKTFGCGKQGDFIRRGSQGPTIVMIVPYTSYI